MSAIEEMRQIDFESFQLIMRIFTRAEIDSTRRSLYSVSRDMGNTPDEAIKFSQCGYLIFKLLNRPRLFKNKHQDNPRTLKHYRDWVNAVKFRDEFTCLICGTKTDIQVHHLKPVKTHPELAMKMCNGVSLCQPCHMRVHHSYTPEELQYFLKGWEI